MNSVAFLTVATAMLSRSKSTNRVRNLESLRSSLVAGPQYGSMRGSPSFTFLSGATPNMMQMAAMVILIALEGFFIAFISTMSSFRSDLSAFSAASSAGIASAKSASHDFFNSLAPSAILLHSAASAPTMTDCSLATILSAEIFTSNASVSIVASLSLGCKSSRKICISLTCSAVSSNLDRPLSYRALASNTSCRWNTCVRGGRTRGCYYEGAVWVCLLLVCLEGEIGAEKGPHRRRRQGRG